jgi:hypothetical protein
VTGKRKPRSAFTIAFKAIKRATVDLINIGRRHMEGRRPIDPDAEDE